MKFNLTLKHADINRGYQDELKRIAQKSTVKGFRPGKAPLNVIEQTVDPKEIYDHVINHLLPHAYADYIREHNLKPLTNPKVTVTSAQKDQDWEFAIEIAEKPKVVLGNVLNEIKGLNRTQIILPQDDPKAPKKASSEEKMAKIFNQLLAKIKIAIPPLILEDEVNRHLSRLVEQIDKLGISLEQYAASLNKNLDQLRAEFQQQAEADLKIEFILEAIAADQKITTSDTEINAFINKVSNPDTKKQLGTKSQREVIRYSLTKKAVLEYLEKLSQA